MSDSARWLRLVVALSVPDGTILSPGELCVASKLSLNVECVSIALTVDDDLVGATLTSGPVLVGLTDLAEQVFNRHLALQVRDALYLKRPAARYEQRAAGWHLRRTRRTRRCLLAAGPHRG